MGNRLIFRSDRPRFKIIINNIQTAGFISPVNRTVPPIKSHIVYQIKILIHANGTVTADIGCEQVTAKHTVMPTYSRPESMIVTIQSFRENRVLNSYVDSRKLQTMSCGITMVYMAIKRHILIQPPAAGAMIDNNITHTVTSQSIIPEEHILRPPTETHMADNNIMRIKQERSPCYTNSIPRSCLTCNSDIRSTDVYRGFQPDNTRNIEHNNTRTTGLTCLTQRSGPTVSQRIDHNYFSSTSTGSIGPSPFCPGKGRYVALY